jgi:hypothetical protein
VFLNSHREIGKANSQEDWHVAQISQHDLMKARAELIEAKERRSRLRSLKKLTQESGMRRKKISQTNNWLFDWTKINIFLLCIFDEKCQDLAFVFHRICGKGQGEKEREWERVSVCERERGRQRDREKGDSEERRGMRLLRFLTCKNIKNPKIKRGKRWGRNCCEEGQKETRFVEKGRF